MRLYGRTVQSMSHARMTERVRTCCRSSIGQRVKGSRSSLLPSSLALSFDPYFLWSFLSVMYSATTVVVVVVADATATAAVVPCQIGCVCFPISLLLLLLPRITLPTETAVAHIHVQPTVKLILSSFPC